MKNKEVLVIAGGSGISTDIENTIYNKVSKDIIIKALEQDKKSDSVDKLSIVKLIKKLKKDLDRDYSIWGYSRNDTTLKSSPPTLGTLVFITYHQAAIYIGEIFEVFESPELNLIWDGRGWDFKIILKDVVQIFIPDSQNINGKDLNSIVSLNRFSPTLESIPNIKKQYDKMFGLRYILNDEQNKGNYQGCTFMNITKNEALKRYSEYIVRTHFECLVKEI